MSETTFKTKFGENLKRAAKAAGLKQDDLADILKKQYGIELTTHSISNHYAGKTLPNVETLKAYCEVFDVKADYLLFGDIDDMKANRPKSDNLEGLDKDSAKTAILALTDFLLLTNFEYEEDKDGYLLLYLQKPDFKQEGVDYFSYNQWKNYLEQAQGLSSLDSAMLKNSEKHTLMEKRVDTAIDEKEIADVLIQGDFFPF